jgi:hypothetical protein
MKTSSLAAIVLIAIGVVAFVYQGITYTTREKAFNIGSLEVTTEQTKTIPLPPVVGGMALVCGIALLVFTNKKIAE